MAPPDWQVFTLRVAAEADPGVLARVLERFQNLNLVPRKVLAEWATTGLLHIEVLIAGLPEQTVDLITAKLGQVPSIVNAYWCVPSSDDVQEGSSPSDT
jgi:hypothetical protein